VKRFVHAFMLNLTDSILDHRNIQYKIDEYTLPLNRIRYKYINIWYSRVSYQPTTLHWNVYQINGLIIGWALNPYCSPWTIMNGPNRVNSNERVYNLGRA